MGYENVLTRDTMTKVGGKAGIVNSTQTVITQCGAHNIDYEWARLTILNNHANAGENVADYNQANSYGDGPTWAGCDEVSDISEKGATLVVRELDLFCAGDDNGRRVGLDVQIGDTRSIHGLPASTKSEATYGVRTTSCRNDPLRTWKIGYRAEYFKQAGFSAVGMGYGSAFEAAGAMDSIIDARAAKPKIVMRFSSLMPAFEVKQAGPQIGRLKIEIDGNMYCIPVHSL